MDWKIILIIFGAIFFNTVMVMGVVFLLFIKKKSLKKIKKRRILFPNKEKLYKKFNFTLFIVFLIVGNILAFNLFSNNKESILRKVKLIGVNLANFELTDKNFKKPTNINNSGLNLVFYADQYENWENFESDIDILMEGLRGISPWDNFNRFNVYKIYPGKKQKLCKIKTQNERKPVIRCSEDINNYLNQISASRLKLIVLSRQEFQSWANLTRLANSGIFFSIKQKIILQDRLGQAILFSHLMGHAFGLKDEEKYVLAKAEGAPHTPDGPNCAPDEETAREWWGDLATEDDKVGYFKTCCGNEEYIKPTESSIMNLNSGFENFSVNYGPVSERYLGKILKYCYSNDKVSYEDDKDFFDKYQEFKSCLK